MQESIDDVQNLARQEESYISMRPTLWLGVILLNGVPATLLALIIEYARYSNAGFEVSTVFNYLMNGNFINLITHVPYK